MPHFSLHRLAQRVGDPTENGRRLTFIDNTARCGSTLLSAMLNTVPGIRVLSEPRTVKFLYSLHIAGKISTAEFGPLVRSSIRLHCKPEKRTTVEHFVIKHWFAYYTYMNQLRETEHVINVSIAPWYLGRSCTHIFRMLTTYSTQGVRFT